MNIETLKDQARRHEQKEEWSKALDLYRKAIGKISSEEQPDIGLYNRAGDIQSRIGDLEGAVKNYERAVELYLEAELPNNAIAICKKVLRNLPARATAYLRMGQIRAAQGFLTDARENFLSYAELMQQAGEMEEAFRALIEFTNLAPHDMDIREGVAAQLASHGSIPEAIEQLTVIYSYRMREGREEAAERVRDQILELDPEADIPTEFAATGAAESIGDDLGFESTSLGMTLDEEDEEDEGDEDDDSHQADYEFGEIEIGGAQPSEPDLDAPPADAGDAAGDDETEVTELVEDESQEVSFELSAPVAPEASDELSIEGDFALEGPEGEVEEVAEAEDPEEDIGLDLPLMSFDGIDSDADTRPDEPVTDSEAEAESTFEIEEEGAFAAEEPDEDEEALPGLDFGMSGDSDEEEDELAGQKISEGAALHLDDFAEVDEEEFPVDLDGELDVEADPDDPGPAADMGIAADADPHESARVRGEELLERGDRAAGIAALIEVHRALADEGQLERAMRVAREVILHDPDDAAHHQTLVEYAYRTNDRTLLISAFLDLAECLVRSGQETKAKAVYKQVLAVDPKNRKATAGMTSASPATPAAPGGSGDGFLDLGSMVLDDGGERTTRWTVSAEAPSGDEEADFRRLLTQFKAKVAENVSGDDFRAHYDLGSAYREMGLLDEAIGEFQQALRASKGNLATYEMLGQCFMEGNQPEVAARTLTKALECPYDVEDELLGIYYYLARAYEAMEERDPALDYYEKVFALDINFMDATERLRALRT